MKRVAIFQHDQTQGAGYLQTFLEREDIPYQIFKPTEGESVPTHASDFSGLVVLGSHHSVNESLLWMEQEAALMLDALHNDRPVLGHCFGGQMLAKVLGAEVLTNPQPHIGWDRVQVTRFPESRNWFGELNHFNAFHWHYQSFTLPPAATRLLFGQYSLNTGFSLGRHLALQCHLEVTEETVRSWCHEGREEVLSLRGDTVEDVDSILCDLPEKLAALHRVSERVYRHWSQGLLRPTHVATPNPGWSWNTALAH